MRPRSAVALRIEDAAPIENIFICRRSPVLAFPKTSLGNLVDLVSYLCFVPRTGTPGHHGPTCRAAGVEFVAIDSDHKRRWVARDRRSPVWLRTPSPAVFKLPYNVVWTRLSIAHSA